jgi:hypothetical protein
MLKSLHGMIIERRHHTQHGHPRCTWRPSRYDNANVDALFCSVVLQTFGLPLQRGSLLFAMSSLEAYLLPIRSCANVSGWQRAQTSEVWNQGRNSLEELPVPQTAEPRSRCMCTLHVPWNQRGCLLGLIDITLLLIQSSCEFASSGYSLSADGSAPIGKKKKQIDMKHIKSDCVPQAGGKQRKGKVEEEWHHRM